MKKLIIISIVLIAIDCNNNKSKTKKEVCLNEKASFIETYKLLRSYEGNYVNVEGDRGGETYGGISRKSHKKWKGWKYIDQQKRHKNIKWNQQLPPIVEHYVLDFYLDIWVKEGFYDLTDQQIANYVFEFRIHGSYAVKMIQRSINAVGGKIQENGIMNKEVMIALNNIDKNRFLKNLKERRISLYYSIAKRDTVQRQFLNHWISRAKNIDS